MILLFTTALAAEPDPDAIRALAERDPHAATLASVGLDVDGLEFLCEDEAPLHGTRSSLFASEWRWAIFTSARPLDELAPQVEADLGPPSSTADGRASWSGRGSSVWFTGNDLAYGAARVDALAAGTPPAHLTCDHAIPRGTRTVVGITAKRKRSNAPDGASFGGATRLPSGPPEPAPPPGCTELPVAAVVDIGVAPTVPFEGDVLLVHGNPGMRVDLSTGEVTTIDARIRAPTVVLPDGRWLVTVYPTLKLQIVDPATWKAQPLPLPDDWTQGWSPLAQQEIVPVEGGVVVRNGFDRPARWRDGAWGEAPPLPEHLFEWDWRVLVLDDGRLLAWGGDEAEIVDVDTARSRPLRMEPGTSWRSAVQLTDGRVLAVAHTDHGPMLVTYDLAKRAPEASLPLCHSVTLTRLASGRVVGAILNGSDATTIFYWVEPPGSAP